MARFKVQCETGFVTFNPSATTDQIILSGLKQISSGAIIEITNSVTNALIYDHQSTAVTATVTWNAALQQNKITIAPASALTGMNATDEIRVYIDYPDKEIPQRCNDIQVGYWAETQMIPITTSTSAYSIGQNIGGVNSVFAMCRNNQGTVDLTDVCIWSLNGQVFSGVIDYWGTSALVGTYTDHTPQVMTGDQDNWLGSVPFSYTDFKRSGTGAGAICRHTVNLPGSLKLQNLSGGQDIYFTITFIPITGSPALQWSTAAGLFVKHGWKKA